MTKTDELQYPVNMVHGINTNILYFDKLTDLAYFLLEISFGNFFKYEVVGPM